MNVPQKQLLYKVGVGNIGYFLLTMNWEAVNDACCVNWAVVSSLVVFAVMDIAGCMFLMLDSPSQTLSSCDASIKQGATQLNNR